MRQTITFLVPDWDGDDLLDTKSPHTATLLERFNATGTDVRQYDGETFRFVRAVEQPDDPEYACDLEVLPMFVIEVAGETVLAFPNEVLVDG